MILTVAAGTVAFGALQGLSHRARRLESAFVRLEGRMNRLNALEWQIAANRGSTRELDRQMAHVRHDVDVALGALAGKAAIERPVRAVTRRYREYAAAVDREVLLLRGRKFEEAEAFDEAVVDPAYEGVTQELEVGERECRSQADFSSMIAIWGAILTLLAQLLAVRHLAGRLQREARRSAAAEERGRLLEESQRSLALANRRLEEANERLAEASRLKSEFLANTSHELRTPLNGMMGFLQLVLDDVCTSKVEEREFVAQALECSRHLLALINDVLDIARIEAGRVSLQFERVSVRELFDEVETMTRAQALGKGLDLAFEMEPGTPPALRGDALKVKQVLVNLVGNAIKFTPSGGVRVRASASGEQGHLRIEVEDTGIGIEPDKLDMVFEKFTQLDGSATRGFGGTGLGLAISRGLVQNMGGLISAHSDGPGLGTRLSLALPIWVEGEVVETAEIVSGGAVSGPEFGPLILLVEDDPQFRTVVRTLLHESGYRTAEAASAESGLVLARRLRPDLAILDFALPSGENSTIPNGWALGKRLASERDTREIPVVFVTGFDEELRQLAAEDTHTLPIECLGKPLDPGALLACAGRLIRGRGRHRTRVLLVDDDPSICTLVGMTLASDPFVLETVTDGAECVHLLRQGTAEFDLLLLDLMMPGTSGYDVLREVCRLGLASSLRVIVFTNAPVPSNEEERRLLQGECVVEVVAKSDIARDRRRLVELLQRHSPSPGDTRGLRAPDAAAA